MTDFKAFVALSTIYVSSENQGVARCSQQHRKPACDHRDAWQQQLGGLLQQLAESGAAPCRIHGGGSV
jgi:hypothetical protein